MAGRRSRTFTEVELEFMQTLWARGESTTEDVREALAQQDRPLSDGSIRKVLSILVDKGHVTRKPKGRGFLYKAKVPAGQANRKMVLDLLDRAFGGSASLMVASLLDARSVRKKDIEAIKRLIADRDGESQP